MKFSELPTATIASEHATVDLIANTRDNQGNPVTSRLNAQQAIGMLNFISEDSGHIAYGGQRHDNLIDNMVAGFVQDSTSAAGSVVKNAIDDKISHLDFISDENFGSYFDSALTTALSSAPDPSEIADIENSSFVLLCDEEGLLSKVQISDFKQYIIE